MAKKPPKKPRLLKTRQRRGSFKVSPTSEKGYELKVTDETFNDAERRIIESLEVARKRLEDEENLHTSAPISHIYNPVPSKDYKGEVEAEWRIDGIRGEASEDLLRKMLESILPENEEEGKELAPILGEGFWIGIGIRWTSKSMSDEEKDEYEKDKGMMQITSNYRPLTRRSKILSAFNAVLEGSSKNPTPMIDLVEDRIRRKVGQAFIKVVWNPDNKQPKRFYKKKDKKEKK